MEIKIDTKNDSVEEIRKVIAFLQKLIDEKSDASDLDSSEGFVNIFGDETPTLGNSYESDDEPDPKDDDNDDFKIVPYDF